MGKEVRKNDIVLYYPKGWDFPVLCQVHDVYNDIVLLYLLDGDAETIEKVRSLLGYTFIFAVPVNEVYKVE